MDYITIHSNTGLLICKECKFAIIPSRVNSHFTGAPHYLSPIIRSNITIYISQIDILDLVTTESQILSTIKD